MVTFRDDYGDQTHQSQKHVEDLEFTVNNLDQDGGSKQSPNNREGPALVRNN